MSTPLTPSEEQALRFFHAENEAHIVLGDDKRIARLLATLDAERETVRRLREALAGAMDEIRRLDPHIQHPDGTGFDIDPALLAETETP